MSMAAFNGHTHNLKARALGVEGSCPEARALLAEKCGGPRPSSVAWSPS